MNSNNTLINDFQEYTRPNDTQDFSALAPVEPKPWSFWATIGFSAIIATAYLIASVVIVVVALVVFKVKNPQVDIEHLANTIGSNGFVAAIDLIIALPVVVGLCVLFSHLRKGITVRQYLGLCPVKLKQIGFWIAILVAFSVIENIFYVLIDVPIVHGSSIQLYESAVFPPLLIFTFIVCAPLMEEFFFRGFLFKGLIHSVLGPTGATIITALIWAVIHTQYEWYGITVIFIGGLLLGIARIRTKSILIPIIMHATMNLIASTELLIVQLF